MRHLARLAACALAAAAAGCSRSSDVADERRDLVSWAGTLSLAARQWGHGLDPTPYTRTVSRAAREALDETSRSLARASSEGSAAAAALRGAAGRIESARQALDAAIARRDGPSAAALAERLDALQRDLRLEPEHEPEP